MKYIITESQLEDIYDEFLTLQFGHLKKFKNLRKTNKRKSNGSFIKIDGEVSERGMDNPFEELDLGPFMPPGVLGVRGIVKSIEHAKTDDNIKGIYLDIKHIQTGFAAVEEIRNALIDFKKSKKFISSVSAVSA